MAPHSSTLAWKIPWMEEPGRLQSVHGVTKSRTRLSNFTFTFHFHALEKEMATHSSVLAWRIPGMGKPNGLLSMGSHRVGHNWRDLAAAALRKVLWQVLEINSKHNWLSWNQCQRSIFLIPFKEIKKEKRKKEPKRPQEKMLSILNYYRNDADQNNNKKSNLIWQNGHPNSLQTVHGGESREIMEFPFKFPVNIHWQQPLEGIACTGQNKTVERGKTRILIPTPGPTLQNTIIQNDTTTPNFAGVVLSIAKADPSKGPLADKIFKKCGTYIQGAITQISIIATEIMKWWQWFPQGWTLEENTPGKVSNRRRK